MGGDSVSFLYLFICLFSDAAVNSLPRFVSGSLLRTEQLLFHPRALKMLVRRHELPGSVAGTSQPPALPLPCMPGL